MLKSLLRMQGVLGVVAGSTLVMDPSGAMFGLQTSWLLRTPVASYTLPGLVIIIGYGLVPLALTIKKPRELPVVLYAIIALCWIMFEALVFQLFHWLHALFAIILLITLQLCQLSLRDSRRADLKAAQKTYHQ